MSDDAPVGVAEAPIPETPEQPPLRRLQEVQDEYDRVSKLLGDKLVAVRCLEAEIRLLIEKGAQLRVESCQPNPPAEVPAEAVQ